MNAAGEEMVGDFYDVFARKMRDLGTPFTPAVVQGSACAFPGALPAAHRQASHRPPSRLALTYRTRKRRKCHGASSIREYNSLCPNILLYWDAIQFARERFASVFDMGRSTPNEGTFKFKAQWGAEPLPLHWEYHLATDRELPNLSPANPKFQRAIAFWQMLPISLTRAVGPRIVRTIP